jgi:predicted permease
MSRFLPVLALAARGLIRRRRGFAALAVLVLAPGLALLIASFALLEAVVLAPLPYHEDARLLWVWSVRPDVDRAFFSIPDFEDFRARSRSSESIAGVTPVGVNLTLADRTLRWNGLRVTGNLFATLGVEAEHGRLLDAGDEAANAPHVVLGWAAFLAYLDGDPSRIGATLILDGTPYIVIGVLGPEFVFPGADRDVQFALPLALAHSALRADRGRNFIRPIVRRRIDATLASVRAEFAQLSADMAREHPATNAMKLAPNVVPLREEMAGALGPVLGLIVAAVSALLAILGVNLGALLLVHLRAHDGEYALQRALGAASGGFIARLLAELGLIAALATVIALLLAEPLRSWLIGLVGLATPRIDASTIAGASIGAGLAAGAIVLLGALAPSALWLRRAGRSLTALRSGARATGSQALGPPLALAAQLALALALLMTLGLAAGTLRALEQRALGFEPEPVLSVRLATPARKFPDAATFDAYAQRLLGAARELPGVKQVALGNALPLSAFNSRVDFSIPGRAADAEGLIPTAQARWVSAAWFETMGIALHHGRVFAPSDRADTESVVLIDAALAEHYWPGTQPIGAMLTIDGQPPARVVGVVATVPHFALDERSPGTIYVPLPQVAPRYLGFVLGRFHLVLRTTTDPAAASAMVERLVREVDPDVPPAAPLPMRHYLSAGLAGTRAAVQLLRVQVIGAALLAAIGIFALCANAIALRRREIGIRLALGSSAGALRLALLRRPLSFAAVGMAIGALIGLAIKPLIAAALGPATALSPTLLAQLIAGFSLLVTLAAWIATLGPAMRTPAEVLRAE